MEDQPTNIFSSSINWLSTKIHRIWKSESGSRPSTKCNIIDKHPQQIKNIVLMKMRKPNTTTQLNQRINKINNFYSLQTNTDKPLQLICPICIDYFIKPIITVCGHTFCQQCLDQSILFTPNCPVCRYFIRGTDLLECKALNDIIFRYMSKYDDDIYRRNYLTQNQQAEKWAENKKIDIDGVKEGDLIDVRDTEFIWCRALINKVYKKGKQNSSILVHYLGWNAIYDQIIDLQSQRLSNYKFYTSRVDIPHYHLNHQSSENMHSYVVIGEPIDDALFNLHLGIEEEDNEEEDMFVGSDSSLNEIEDNPQQQQNKEQQ